MNRPIHAAEGFLSLRPGTQFLQKGRQVVVTFPETEDADDYMLWVKWVWETRRRPMPKPPESAFSTIVYDLFSKQRNLITALLDKLDRVLLPAARRGGAS